MKHTKLRNGPGKYAVHSVVLPKKSGTPNWDGSKAFFKVMLRSRNAKQLTANGEPLLASCQLLVREPFEKMKPETPPILASSSTSSPTNNIKRSSKMSVFARHYRALMWKNFVLRRRRPYFLVAELLVPVSIPVILLIIRSQEPDKPRPT
ncbi:hypothetical protein X801_04536, partial [Opisthorchis viverrini]